MIYRYLQQYFLVQKEVFYPDCFVWLLTKYYTQPLGIFILVIIFWRQSGEPFKIVDQMRLVVIIALKGYFRPIHLVFLLDQFNYFNKFVEPVDELGRESHLLVK